MKRGEFSRILILWMAGALGATAGVAQAPQPAAKPAEQKPSATEVKLAAQMPAGTSAKPYHFPRTETRTLANGLRVFVASSRNQPAVTARLVLTSAGSIHDPAGKPGVAAMTADMLTQGTEKRTAQQIAEAIDFVGGSLSSSADHDGTYVTVSVVKKDLSVALDLLSDVALHANFRQEELDRRRQQLLSSLRVQYADPQYLATAILNRVVFGQSPYGLPTEGTPQSAGQLAREDLARFRDAYYAPNQALLAFAGDITAEEAFAAAEKYFGGWAKKDVPATQIAAPAVAEGWRLFLIDKPDAVQTQIRFGRLGIRRNDPDYIPLYVTNRIFGGGYNSRLNTEVRIKKGLTYGANSSFNTFRLAGSFSAGTFTRTEATVEATKLVLDQIRKMASGDVTPAELDFSRDYLAGVFPIQTETAEQVAGRVLAVAQYDLPVDYNDTYPERVRSVTVDQVKAMAARYFDIANLDLVLVGNAAQFREALKKEFPNAKVEELPFDQVDLLAADLRRPKEAAMAITPESLERGRAILEEAVQAAGGVAVGKVESLEVTSAGKIFSPQGEFAVESKVWVTYPDRVRLESKLPFGVLRRGFDGKTGWLASPQGAMDMPASMNAEFQRGADLVGGVGLFRKFMAGQLHAQGVGEETLEGKKALAVEWLDAPQKVRLYFDPETHFLIGARYRQTLPQGTSEALDIWSDFRPVPGAEGLKFPHHILNYRDGAKFSESTVQDVKANTKPDPALFAKPSG